MNDEQLLRYSRQIMLPEIDAEGQIRLAEARALIIGIGGLGSAASIYLTAAGVGKLVLVDFDKVDLSNLQRQIVHGNSDIGRPKVESARDHLLALNPDIKLVLIDHALQNEELSQQVELADVVIDASDNFQTRFAINQACFDARTPLVSAAAIRFEAQISVFNTADENSPCYRCLYGESAAVEETCTENGVMSPLLGIVGSIQAAEAMKLIMEVGRTLQGKLMLIDILNMEWHTATLPKNPACPVCGHAAKTKNSNSNANSQATDA